MSHIELVTALRAAPAIAGTTDVAVPEEVVRAAGDAIEALVDLLVEIHAYHDVPGEKDGVLERMFIRGAAALATLEMPFPPLRRDAA